MPVRSRSLASRVRAPGAIYAGSAFGYSDVADLLSTRLASFSVVGSGPPARALIAPSLLAKVGNPGVACSELP